MLLQEESAGLEMSSAVGAVLIMQTWLSLEKETFIAAAEWRSPPFRFPELIWSTYFDKQMFL